MLNNKVSGILQFDSITGEYISPTLLLCKRNGDVIAKLPYSNLNTSLVGIGLDEISFDCHKEDFENLYTDSTLTKKVWDELEGLKIIDYRCNGEKFKQFEANVTVNDENETIKSVTCVSLENELGQRILHSFYVNDFINDPDHKRDIDFGSNGFINTVLCNKENQDFSLLHRALKEKAPHWSVGETTKYVVVGDKVEPTNNFVRTFAVDGTSIYDFFTNKVANEANVVFTFDTYHRLVNMYSLVECVFDATTYDVLKDYKYDKISKSYYKKVDDVWVKVADTSNLNYVDSIGDDTNILISKRNLGQSFSIQEDTDSVKNCLYVTGGDDEINDIIAAANQTASNEIIGFSSFQYNEMSDELSNSIKSYKQFLDDTKYYFSGSGGIYVKNTEKYEVFDGEVIDKTTRSIITNARIKNNEPYLLEPLAYKKDNKIYDKYDNIINPSDCVEETDIGVFNSNNCSLVREGNVGIFTMLDFAIQRKLWNESGRMPNTDVNTGTTALKEAQRVSEYLSSNPVIIQNSWNTKSFSHVTNTIETMINVVASQGYTFKLLNKFSKEYEDIPSPTVDNNSDELGSIRTWVGYFNVVNVYDINDIAEKVKLEISVKKIIADDVESYNQYCLQKLNIAMAKTDTAKIFNSVMSAYNVDNIFHPIDDVALYNNAIINDDNTILIDGNGGIVYPLLGTVGLKKGVYIASFTKNISSSLTNIRVDMNTKNRRRVLIIDGETEKTNRINTSGEAVKFEVVEDCSLDVHLDYGEVPFETETIYPMIQRYKDDYLTTYKSSNCYDEDIKSVLNQYNLNQLKTFSDGFSSCIVTLEQEAMNMECSDYKVSLSSSYSDLYYNYTYYGKICREIYEKRKQQVDDLDALVNQYSRLIDEYRKTTNIKTYFDFKNGESVGQKIWKEYNSYIREGEYNNGNYCVGTLNTQEEKIAKANELLNKAKQELDKSCVLQKTVSGNVYNIFTQKQLAMLWESFNLFNYIRVEVDDKIYQLRLIKIDFNTDDLSTINVAFSEKIEDVYGKTNDLKSLLESAATIATSYSATIQQASQGNKAMTTYRKIKSDGLNSAEVIIKNSDSEEVVIDNNGVNCSSMNDIGEYGLCQARLVGNGLYMTDDGWNTIRSALGKIKYNDKWLYGLIADVIIGDLICTEELRVLNENSSVIIDKEGIEVTNGVLYIKNDKDGKSVKIDPTQSIDSSGHIFSITNKDGTETIYADENGDAYFDGHLVARSLTISDARKVKGMKIVESTSYYYTTSSSASIPTSGWTSSKPTSFTKGSYYWVKIVTSYTDKSFADDISYNCSYIGTNGRDGYDGDDGVSVDDVRIMYGVSYSSSTSPSSWSTVLPEKISLDQYVWTRTDVKYSDQTNYTLGTPKYDAQLTAQTRPALAVEINSEGVKIHPVDDYANYMNLVSNSIDIAIDNYVKAHFGSDGIWLGGSSSQGASSSYYAFKVDSLGNGYFAGDLQSLSGKIGGWIIDETNLYSECDGYKAYIQIPNSDKNMIGEANVGNYVFSVQEKIGENAYKVNAAITARGQLICKNGLFNSINKAMIYFNGTNLWIGSRSASTIATDSFGETNIAAIGNVNIHSNKQKEYVARFTDQLIHFKPGLRVNHILGTNSSYGVKMSVNNNFIPCNTNGNADSSGTVYLGTIDNRFAGGYLMSGAISTSDKNLKKDINILDSKYLELFSKLTPVTYKLIEGTSGRTHVGFISQDIEKSMQELGMTGLDFAGFCKDVKSEEYIDEDGVARNRTVYDEDGNEQYIYSLRYEEFIAMNTAMIQKQQKIIDCLQKENEDLKEKYNNLEERLKKLEKLLA